MKRAVSFVLIAAALIFCCSCAGTGRTIDIVSADYPRLRKADAGECDKSYRFPVYPAEYFQKVKPGFGVRESNGKLAVEKFDHRYAQSSIIAMSYGYFVGMATHDEGWVCYYPYGCNISDIEPQTVAAEMCIGLIRVDDRHGYAITYDYFYEGLYHIYSLTLSENGIWSWQTEATTEDVICTYLYDKDEKCIYVITTSGVYVFLHSERKLTELKKSEILAYTGANSAVMLNGSLYCGSLTGIYEYDIAAGKEYWYPIDCKRYTDS